MIPLVTPRLIVRNWEPRDADLFHLINSDERVMEFFPFRRDREQSDALRRQLRERIEANGFGFTALEIRQTGECIGFCGLHADSVVPTLSPGTVEIGWRLAPSHWGRGYVTEAAEALLEFGFGVMGLDEIVSFAVWNNRRSTAVMERLGMRRDASGDFDHPRVPDTHPHLKKHVLYRLARSDWQARERAV